MSFVEDIFDSLTGKGAREASQEATEAQLGAVGQQIAAQERATEQGLGFLSPFAQIGQQGVGQAGFLANPQAQFDFLQNNPLFQAALQNANQATNARAAAGGRLGAGDTLQQLSQNLLTTATPLIDRQRQDIGNLLNLGTGIAQSQANTAIGQGSNLSNLFGDIGNINAANIAAQQGARDQAANTALNLGSLFAFSDSRLKRNAEIVGHENGYDIWKWEWNADAWEKFGLRGKSKGVMFSDVVDKNPEATSYEDGYGKVNYAMIGIKNGH